MVGSQQRAATRWHVFPPFDVQAVERVRGNPQQQSQQGIGKQIKYVHRGRERHDRGPEKERRQSDMQIVRKAGIDGGCKDHPNKRQKIGEGNDAAFVVFLGPVLNQGVDGNDEESTCKTQCSQENEHLKKGQSVKGNGQSKHRHADGAKRDEAVLDLSRRE